MLQDFKILIFASALILSAGSAGYAQDDKAPAADNAPAVKMTSGTVAQVGFVESFLMVATPEGYLNFTVTDKTSILIGPEKASLSDIKPEDTVRIQYYSPEPGKYVAVAITESRRSYD